MALVRTYDEPGVCTGGPQVVLMSSSCRELYSKLFPLFGKSDRQILLISHALSRSFTNLL
jgi:hypothetical protein